MDPILVADDDPVSNRLIRGLLEKWNFKVAVATHGEEALEQLRSASGPSLAILDWVMPGLSGPDICRQLRDKPPARPIYLILLTFRSSADDIAQGLEAGADDYLIKPCEPTELRARVNVGLRMLELQKALLFRVDQMNRFLGMAAHDLRNPLACIKIYSAFLLDAQFGSTLNPKQERFVNSIRSSSEFMLRLVENFLETSAIQEGKLTLTVSTHDLVKLVQSNIEMNQVLAQRKDIKLTFVTPVESLLVPVDADKIEQVMNNLISNATKYSCNDTVVQVSLRPAADEVVIAVQDQGPGIAPEQLNNLFRAYSKAGTQPTGGERSTGLGLSIARRIVEGHGGRIWVDSVVDQGSTFQLALPLRHNGHQEQP